MNGFGFRVEGFHRAHPITHFLTDPRAMKNQTKALAPDDLRHILGAKVASFRQAKRTFKGAGGHKTNDLRELIDASRKRGKNSKMGW